MRITKQTFCNIYLPVLLFLIAFCWKLWYIGTQDISLDEPFTIFHAQFGIWDILKLPGQGEPTPPLFMLLLHFWIKIFGISAYSVRILPLLFNALTPVFIYLTGKKIFSLWTGILASGLFILSTYHFYFGLETRTYSLFYLATAASLYYFLSLINNFENKKLLIALVLSNLLLVYSHYFGWFVVFMQFLLSFMYFENKKLFRTLIITTILTGLFFLPMVPVLFKQFFTLSKGTWVQPPSSSEYLNQLWLFLNSKIVFEVIVIILIAGVVYLLLRKSHKKINRELIIVFFWWFVPFTFMFIVSAKVPMFINGYILFNSIGLYIFIAAAINIMYNQTLAYIISVLLLVLMFTQLQINAKDFNYREVKNAVNKVKSETTHNSIVLIYPHWADLGFMYYFNSGIFKDFNTYNSSLIKNKIFPVWNVFEAKEYIEKYKGNRIIYFQDGQPGDNTIYNYLDSTYTRLDSSFYPQHFHLGVYDSK